jgi:hypothetical protein
VQDQWLPPALLTQRRALQEFCGQLTTLLLMDLPAHALTAIDVLYQIEVVVLTPYR